MELKFLIRWPWKRIHISWVNKTVEMEGELILRLKKKALKLYKTALNSEKQMKFRYSVCLCSSENSRSIRLLGRITPPEMSSKWWKNTNKKKIQFLTISHHHHHQKIWNSWWCILSRVAMTWNNNSCYMEVNTYS